VQCGAPLPLFACLRLCSGQVLVVVADRLRIVVLRSTYRKVKEKLLLSKMARIITIFDGSTSAALRILSSLVRTRRIYSTVLVFVPVPVLVLQEEERFLTVMMIDDSSFFFEGRFHTNFVTVRSYSVCNLWGYFLYFDVAFLSTS
jgi:hypothetical protein